VGRKVSAVISDMDQPLGNAVGNALEVREAIETLRRQGPADFLNVCLTVGAQMLLLAGKAADASEGKSILLARLISGEALTKFRQWIVAQGGDPRLIDNLDLLPKAAIVDILPAHESGYVAEIDAEVVGLTSVMLGGGRSKKGDAVDPAVGLVLKAKVGDRVQVGAPLVTIYANDPGRLLEARERLLTAYRFSASPVVRPKLIRQVI
jgi:pyrimidine-nucleoside phosphorylase